MNEDNKLDFLEEKPTTIFTQIDEEKQKEKQQELENLNNSDFITDLPEWDLVPPVEYVKRVVRQ